MWRKIKSPDRSAQSILNGNIFDVYFSLWELQFRQNHVICSCHWSDLNMFTYHEKFLRFYPLRQTSIDAILFRRNNTYKINFSTRHHRGRRVRHKVFRVQDNVNVSIITNCYWQSTHDKLYWHNSSFVSIIFFYNMTSVRNFYLSVRLMAVTNEPLQLHTLNFTWRHQNIPIIHWTAYRRGGRLSTEI